MNVVGFAEKRPASSMTASPKHQVQQEAKQAEVSILAQLIAWVLYSISRHHLPGPLGFADFPLCWCHSLVAFPLCWLGFWSWRKSASGRGNCKDKGIDGKTLGNVQGGQSLGGWNETSRRRGCSGRAELGGQGKEHRFLSLRTSRSLFLLPLSLPSISTYLLSDLWLQKDRSITYSHTTRSVHSIFLSHQLQSQV